MLVGFDLLPSIIHLLWNKSVKKNKYVFSLAKVDQKQTFCNDNKNKKSVLINNRIFRFKEQNNKKKSSKNHLQSIIRITTLFLCSFRI